MTLQDKIAELPKEITKGSQMDIAEMTEDIYYHFSKLDDFEILKIEQTGEADRMVLAACLTTMADPFFKIVVAHTWQSDLAYDDQWSEFETRDNMTIFRFLTWEDEYISGEIWFERAKLEVQK